MHSEPVYAIARGPGDLYASGGGDDVAYVFQGSSGDIVHKLEGHTDSVVAVSFNFDGTLVATGGYDGVVKIWQVETGQLLQSLEGPSEEVEWMQWHSKVFSILVF